MFQQLKKNNLQRIRTFLVDKKCSSYSIAMNSATRQGDSFIDIRVMICVASRNEHILLFAIPLTESQTELVMLKGMRDLLRGA